VTFESILFLGTGGWTPRHNRQTTCVALVGHRTLVLLDAGTGVGHLLDPALQAIVRRAERVCILLSHFHLDHTVGLSVAPGVFYGKRVSIHGPGPACSTEGTEVVLRRLLSSPLFGQPLEKFPMELEIHDLTPGLNEIADEVRVTVRVQPHVDPTIGIRLDRERIAFITDTACADETVAFVEGCSLLLHDAYFDDDDVAQLGATAAGAVRLRQHGCASGVADIVRRARVDRAYLMHLNPEYSPERVTAMHRAASQTCPHLFLPSDLDRIPL
jgi:ribonuclease BN (tRNA processing enzyme)